jgi:hypothetical protein
MAHEGRESFIGGAAVLLLTTTVARHHAHHAVAVEPRRELRA